MVVSSLRAVVLSVRRSLLVLLFDLGKSMDLPLVRVFLLRDVSDGLWRKCVKIGWMIGKDSELLTTRFLVVCLLYYCSRPLSLSGSTKRVACRIKKVSQLFRPLVFSLFGKRHCSYQLNAVSLQMNFEYVKIGQFTTQALTLTIR